MMVNYELNIINVIKIDLFT